MQIGNCHLRFGGDSLGDEVYAAAFAVVAFGMVLGPFVTVIGGLDIPAVGEMVVALISWHKLCL